MWIFIKSIGTFLNQKDTPIWLTLLLVIGGAAGTYWLAPNINAEFEKQKIRSAYIISSLNTLNKSTRNLVKPVSIVTNRLIDNENIEQRTLDDIRAQISELQWRAVEYRLIFDDKKSIEIIENYQKELSDVNLAFDKSKNQLDRAEIIKEIKEFSQSSIEIFKMISKGANINIETPTLP